MLKTLFENKGFQAAAVMDGGEALDHIHDYSPDPIILDLMLPNKGGVEILRSMPESGQGKIPVIVISARHLDLATKDMIKMEGNVLGVVGKPFQHDILVTKPQYSH